MQRWNGWGYDTVHVDLPVKARNLLLEHVGKGNPGADYSLETFIKSIPSSRLPEHPLISVDPKNRLDHSHGQSLPDWIALRGGLVRSFPDGVALPSTQEEVSELLNFSNKNDVIIIPFGGGTSVAGQLQVPEEDRPILSLSLKRLNRLLDLNPSSLLATFESGIMGPDIEARLSARGHTLGHYPQSFEFSTLGGWVATRSSGQQSSHYGRIEQLFAGGELLTPRGSLKMPPFPATAAGPDLRHLVLGSEGRLGVITRVVVRISHTPEKDDVYGVFFPSWAHAKEAVQTLAVNGIPFSMIRLSNPAETTTNLALIDRKNQISLLKHYLRLRGILEEEVCMCLIGFTGSKQRVKTAWRESLSILRKYKSVYVGKMMGDAWKRNRFRTPYLRNTLWEMGYAVDTLETAVTWDKISQAMEAIENAVSNSLAAWSEQVNVFSHLSHIYSTGSSIYTTCIFRLSDTPEETLARWKSIKKAASRTIVETGGTISHHHGIGVDHKPYLAAEKGPLGMSAIEQLFSHFDPKNRMNPTKLV
ncbi:FAD-binding oxidoreductase [Thermodesulfobacteriota bacterium]